VGGEDPERAGRDDRGPADQGVRLSGEPPPTRDSLERVVREEHHLVLAALARDLGDLELAEDVLQDAIVAAMDAWPGRGVPDRPAAWLLTVARRRAIDVARRDAVGRRKAVEALEAEMRERPDEQDEEETAVPDERLGLIFACCHPALAPEARWALTLRTLGGLTTPQIARAFLVPEATLAQRIVRAKRKIARAGIPLAVPPDHALPERLGDVLAVVYLIYNEGHLATSGDAPLSRELVREAIRLARALDELMPDEPEAAGLLALVLLSDARHATRVDELGVIVPLEEQDRARWDGAAIAEGVAILDRAMRRRRPGPYQLQAAISALHSTAPGLEDTDWRQIVLLYGELERLSPTPVVALNAAVARGMAFGPERGLAELDRLGADPEVMAVLDQYHLWPAARAELLRRAGRARDAHAWFERAAAMAPTTAERAHLERRLRQTGGG
jgi:RNA polymerase sigma-70 factor (ECF subfamily)